MAVSITLVSSSKNWQELTFYRRLYAVGVGWVLVSMIALQVEIRRFEEDQR